MGLIQPSAGTLQAQEADQHLTPRGSPKQAICRRCLRGLPLAALLSLAAGMGVLLAGL